MQFDNVDEAKNYFDNNLSDIYKEDFQFWREGWQYILPNGDVVDLEVAEDRFPTIEFKSETESGIKSLIDKFDVAHEQIIIGPSVVAMRKLIKYS